MGEVVTVAGPIDSAEIGTTLMHEHLFINLLREYRGDGLLNDPRLAAEECARFAALGGRTVVDCTNGSMGRDPELLRQVSTEAGINIVMGSGHYRVPYLDAGWMDAHSVDEVAEQIVVDLTVGVADTGIRAGIIGEIGADKWYVSAHEERSFRAAARAHRRTGVTISTHAARWPVGLAQLDLLAEEGVDPARVIVGHCDTVPIPEYHLDLARRGAYVQFDNIRGLTTYDLERQVEYVLGMRRAGYLDRVLLSHDVCLRSHLAISKGPGFTLVMSDFLPRLRSAGLSQEEVRVIMVDNPRRALTGDN
ncbi:MAG TPA: hypothetical protein VIR27_08745 [Mycobacteriales bacterium]